MASGFSILTGTFDKSQWLHQINNLVNQDALLAASQIPISVFRLPESVHDVDPTAYLPRHVAFGPFHHFQPELYKMELFKLGKAKNLKWGPQIHKLSDRLTPLELKIRACFDQALEINGETLSWLLLIDGLFLIYLLQNEYMNCPLTFPSEIFYGKLWSEFEIVCDMVKLENQIPLFVLNEICPEEPINFLAPSLYQFCVSVSPFQLPCFNPRLECFGFSSYLPEIFDLSHHLLHFLYSLILLIPNERVVFVAHCFRMDNSSSSSSSVEFLSECLDILGSVINIAFIQQIKETIGLIQRLLRLLSFITKPNLAEKTPLLIIPSASDLKSAGFTFKSTKNGILKSNFDETTLTLTLPCIHLDGFTHVLLKNLVAFEAMAELNPPCLANYTALMNGLLRNSKDLKVLEKAEIVHNHLNSEEEAAELFYGVENSTSKLKKGSLLKIHLNSGFNFENGSKFIQEVESSYIEMGLGDMVERINNCYGNCWRMKMKKFVSVVYKCFAVLVVVFLIVLVTTRFVCNFLSCPFGTFMNTTALHQML
ncbi:putative UPF0481 protein At3g02645 [Cucumis sativus]|uniref:Uncharacterized protein n=1 Tax=Cucumis sativus TaxID=3659 RepID=A0A0A0KSX9_CUCSA|nr:putative UPF0481 protein At3g02645 [Cucumis sativus]KGN52693.1 hypothetical protein Csa_008317 [Cucumis sativus]